MKPSRTRRSKYFVDSNVQGYLLTRVTKYWVFSVATVGVLSFVGWVFITPGIGAMVGPDGRMSSVLSAMVVSLVVAVLLLPLVIIDFTRMSHRFVGPVLRLQQAMRAAAEGEPVEPIQLRKDDFWQDVANDFNAMLERLQAAERNETPRRQSADEPVLEATR